MSERCKTYVAVLAKFDEAGAVIPLKIKWEDGRVFCVDKVEDKRRTASLKGGGTGERFTIRIEGKKTHLWRDGDNWFVERRMLKKPRPQKET